MSSLLYDGVAYIIDDVEALNRGSLLTFFLEGHREDVLVLYEKDGRYNGIITYKSLLNSTDPADAVLHEKLMIEDDFWEKADELLLAPGDILPVFDHNMEMQYLAKYEMKLSRICEKLCVLQERVDAGMLQSFSCYGRLIHMKGLRSSIAWYLRKWLLSLDAEVSVEGGWKLFGVEETVCPAKDAVVIDDESAWLELLYAEYANRREEDRAKLGKLLEKPYDSNQDNAEKNMFFVSRYFYFVDSIYPLISRYIQAGKVCVAVFPSADDIITVGNNNAVQMINIIKRLEASGVKCRSCQEPGLYQGKYQVCYLNSEYSGRLPLELRKRVRYVVGLQTTAVYTHMYFCEGRFEEVFSAQARSETDYLVASGYIADWICERDPAWDEKILRFGYPKLDTLYHAIKSVTDIPEEWKEKTAGKKVFLFAINEMQMQQSWLEFFAANDDVVAIWRPHPLLKDRASRRRKAEELAEKYNIIIDWQPSYIASFQIADACIASPGTSVMVNYLYTGKPVCIYDSEEDYKRKAMDYREETWYKSAYAATEDKDVLQFVRKVERGENVLSEEQRECRKCVTAQFDGEVCSRIFDYFEERMGESKCINWEQKQTP